MITTNFKKLTLTFLIFTSIPSFAVDKVVDGSAGSDTLVINYSGISSLSDFTVSASGDYTVLTDSNGNTIQYKNIQELTVGSFDYINNT